MEGSKVPWNMGHITQVRSITEHHPYGTSPLAVSPKKQCNCIHFSEVSTETHITISYCIYHGYTFLVLGRSLGDGYFAPLSFAPFALKPALRRWGRAWKGPRLRVVSSLLPWSESSAPSNGESLWRTSRGALRCQARCDCGARGQGL